MKYRDCNSYVFGQPWAITESKMHEIVEYLTLRAAGEEIPQEKIDEVSAKATKRSARDVGNVAVIPIIGTIVNRGTSMNDSGLTSVQALTKRLRAAMEDKSVGSVVLDVDSPGGSVEGIADLASEIRQSRQIKPITASVNGFGASAAYYLASQANRLTMTNSSMVGSIGVIVEHRDISERLAKEGIKITTVTAGKNKAMGSPFKPLSKEAKEKMQSVADTFYEMMITDIGKGRGVPAAVVDKSFGKGLLFQGKEALKLGMVDAVEPQEATLATAMMKAQLAAAASAILTITEYETFLRDAGFSRSTAKRYASVGFGREHRDDAFSEMLLETAAKHLK